VLRNDNGNINAAYQKVYSKHKFKIKSKQKKSKIVNCLSKINSKIFIVSPVFPQIQIAIAKNETKLAEFSASLKIYFALLLIRKLVLLSYL
jgi:hypothetical protein